MIDGLNQLPSPLPDIFDSPVEWINIINLDREIFSVNYGAHFKLKNISRNDLWIKALEEDIYRRITLSTDICPAASITWPAVNSTMDDETLHRYESTFWEFSRSLVQPKEDLDPDSECVHGQIFLVLIFVAFRDRYRDHLASFGLEWSHDDFVFRELAFAIVSLAPDQLLFHSLPRRDCDPNYCLGFDRDHPRELWL
jgi:hypothetical protein